MSRDSYLNIFCRIRVGVVSIKFHTLISEQLSIVHSFGKSDTRKPNLKCDQNFSNYNKLASLEPTLVWNSADGQNDLLTGVECRAPSVAKKHQFWRKEAFERAVSIKQKHKFDDIIDDNPKNHSDWQCCDDVKKKVQEPAQGDHLKLSV